ncbi:phage tail tape measure protein [Kitasatospora sp. NPDC056076]|uniref:phage tail tape measure protein n=1 Tax=Kitasatospora sp. NPDC056076 TaxID=3345703 RepID=UPI0035DF7DA4
MSSLPPVFIEFLGSAKGVKTALADVKTSLAAADAEGAGAFQKTGQLGKAALAGVAVAAAEAAKHTITAAADFETQMVRVRTGAGELAGNMRAVSAGVLSMAGEVGQSTEHLTAGLYQVESAGYHGADALTVLRNSAEGARVGAAELSTVADATTTAMNAYKMSASDSASATNALIATESEGKTNLEALAASMSSILPTAAAAHVGLNEVLGAMATMTSQGTPAAVAATYLRQTIGALSNPTGKAAQQMKSLGLDAVQVGQNLGKNGLASTLEMLTNAIEKRMGPSGTVLIEHLRKAAQGTTDYEKVLADLKPEQQTYIASLANMVGGTKSMMAALQLTGPHMEDFKAKTAAISEHVKKGGKEIEGWGDVQGTFNQKMAEAKAATGAMAIQVGQYLMPVASRAVALIASGASWLGRHKVASQVAAGVIGGVLVIALAAATAQMWAWTAAALANPVTWVIVGIVAVIAVVVLLVTHWRSAWGVVKGVAVEVGRVVTGTWRWVADETSSIWRRLTGWLSDTWHGIANFFTTAWHAVADPVVAGWRFVENLTTAIFGGIAAFFRKWWPLLLVIFAPPIAILLAIWNHWHEEIIGTAKSVWSAVADFFSAIWRAIAAAADFSWRYTQMLIIQPLRELYADIVSLWQICASWLSENWQRISNLAARIWAQIRERILEPVLQVWRDVSGVFGKIAHAVGSALSAALHSAADVGGQFLDVGKNIVMGIVHGIEGAGHWVVDKLKHLASDALAGAKKFLGINSPSRVMADEVGRWIPHGIAQGVVDHAHVAAGAVAALSAGLSAQTVTPQLALAGSSVGAAGGAGSGGAVAEVTTIVQLDGHELFRAVQPHALRNDRRNPRPGLVYARAAA